MGLRIAKPVFAPSESGRDESKRRKVSCAGPRINSGVRRRNTGSQRRSRVDRKKERDKVHKPLKGTGKALTAEEKLTGATSNKVKPVESEVRKGYEIEI